MLSLTRNQNQHNHKTFLEHAVLPAGEIPRLSLLPPSNFSFTKNCSILEDCYSQHNHLTWSIPQSVQHIKALLVQAELKMASYLS
jgi:hypothetical protein